MTEKEQFEYKTKYPDQIDFTLLFYRYARFWYLFVAGVIVTVLLAFLYLGFTTPKYRVSTTIKIRGVNRDPDYQAGSPGFRRLDVFDTAPNLDDEILALRSLSLMERVVQELGFNVNYSVEEGFREKELYGQEVPLQVIIDTLFEEAYTKELSITILDRSRFRLEEKEGEGAEHIFGQQLRLPYGIVRVISTPRLAGWNNGTELNISFNNPAALATHYNELVEVVQVGEESSVLSISILYPHPQKAKDILNTLVELYNREAREDRNRLAISTIRFIDDRLRELTDELTGVERGVEEFRRENLVTDPRADAAATLEESRLANRQLSELNIQIDVLRSLERYLAQPRQRYELVPSNLNIDDPTLLELITRFNQLQLERERKLRNIEPTNPLILNLSEQLEALRQNILENLGVIREGLLVNRGNLAERAGAFRQRIERLPGIERELNEINRQLGVQQDLYTFLLQRREEAALSLAAVTPTTQLIDPALASKRPVEPNKPIVLAIALVMGLALPFAFIFAMDFLDNSVQQRKEVEQLSVVPVVGEVPHISRWKKWVAQHEYSTPFAEHIRFIISNLHTEAQGREQKVLMVTSGRNSEGKTFVSKNLALSLALAGNKVLLLEMDVRKPSVLKELGLASKTGVADYLLSEKVSIDEILLPSTIEHNLLIAGAGSVPANPALLFNSNRLSELFADLKEQFDYIVVDTAPVGKVADGFALAPYADQTIYLVRYEKTLKADITSVNSMFAKKKLKQLYVVLNDARKMNTRHLA